MKIGLIVYSGTGNTRYVAKKIHERLSGKGHSVSLEEITIKGDTPAQPGKFTLEQVPAVDGYEALILGAPVQAFSLNPVMKAYLDKLPDLTGKKVAVFVTKQLPLLRVGGTGAISLMEKSCREKGADLLGSAIVVWAKSKRDRTVRDCVDKLDGLFG